MSHEHHDEHQPCLYCHPHTYIRMVQHLIERCLLLRMSQDQCIEALSTRANIQPLITLTVWKELLKVNRDFFRSYFDNTTSPTLSSRRNIMEAKNGTPTIDNNIFISKREVYKQAY
ncbi:hypothetical protein MKW94_010730 [Papaver nudicaule]|uniref:Angiotensin-converting enzyme 2 n=1 Tax=Papaver nudicaule TaxID=74823 RepID=A0AA41RXB8_PAPNU|nr:hypothetical protein [Papaver nudicaule]MCL7026265.1 hypothetical protein [Papaver nudicaule]